MRPLLPGAIRRPRRPGALALCAALAAALAACKTVDEPAPPKVTFAARLAPTGGSTMTGGASFWAVDGGVGMTVTIANVATGEWRVVLHANGNCSSRNGFSAGPPLAVPGAASPIVVYMVTGDNMPGGGTYRLPGLALEGPNGVLGRSVVVHSGSVGPLEAVPDVPNDRYACGVIERVKPLF